MSQKINPDDRLDDLAEAFLKLTKGQRLDLASSLQDLKNHAPATPDILPSDSPGFFLSMLWVWARRRQERG